MLPVLGALEDRYRDEPVVVAGIHSNKFPGEGAPDRIRSAMRRYGVTHPVLADTGRRVWQLYTVRAWPTIVFIRPDGTIAAALAGEQRLSTLESVVDDLLDDARARGTLGERFEPVRERPPSTSALAYPGAVVATPQGLAIADSGHHRVVLVDGKGGWIRSIGAEEPGYSDGESSEARFRRPQGLALSGTTLFVADTGNHAIRTVDLESFRVDTVAGNGRLGRTVPQDLTDARDVALRSPWAVEMAAGILFIAMAGAHQIWAYVPEDRTIAVFAGSGREAIDDGPFHEATFAQPSGLAVSGARLFVADSETSAVRVIDLSTATVSTLVGRGLFEFGDQDGPSETARLQHPQDVATGPHGLLVADTYNDKIKHVDEATGLVTTWFSSDGPTRLSEPSGLLQLEGGQVVVSDTNAHRIVVIQTDSDGARTAKALPLAERDDS